MKNKKVAVIGSEGYVGKAYAEMLSKRYQVVGVDPAKPDYDKQFDEANQCDLAVVCVPTAMREDGRADISIVKEVVEKLRTPLILIKSTIPPHTTNDLIDLTDKKIVFSPEYIGEGGYTIPWWKGWPHPRDASVHNFMILGGERQVVLAIAEFFKPILGPDCHFHFTNSETAELVKYMENAFLATKVSFCNEFYSVAKVFGVDYDELRELWLLDGRINRSHTLVFPEKRGFSGKCLPKDVNGLVARSCDAGYEPKLLKAVLEFNKNLNK